MRIKRTHGERRSGRPHTTERPVFDLALTIEDIERDLQFGTGARVGPAPSNRAFHGVSPRR